MDNDGWLDIFVANGHVYPQFDTIPNAAHFRQPMLLFHNQRHGTFEEVSKEAGLADISLESRRGVAFGDINNDGCVDIVVLNVGAPPSLLLNHCQNGNHRVLFRLLGSKSNRLAIGARVTVRTGKLMQMNEVKGGSSYISQSDLRQHFGLEAYDTIDEVSIRWPNGVVDTLHNVPADFIYTVVEGRGIQDKMALPSPGVAGRFLTPSPLPPSEDRLHTNPLHPVFGSGIERGRGGAIQYPGMKPSKP
jgi:hypothetical protein